MAQPILSSPSDSESDHEAPESVALSQSKKNAKRTTARLQAAQIAANSQRKVKNRERDRKLKERAEKTRGTGVLDGETEAKAVKRRKVDDKDEDNQSDDEVMDPEADEDEDSEDDADDDEWGGLKDGVPMDIGVADDSDSESNDEDDETNDNDEDMNDLSHSKHLPDHLFKSAFNFQPSKTTIPSSPAEISVPKKRKRKFNRPKDLIVGSRTIRKLPDNKLNIPNASRTVPSAKVRKFIDRSLGLKGKRSKSWQRVPVNIGVMKRNGPAAHFVRNPV